jgi:hypothetical protein
LGFGFGFRLLDGLIFRVLRQTAESELAKASQDRKRQFVASGGTTEALDALAEVLKNLVAERSLYFGRKPALVGVPRRQDKGSDERLAVERPVAPFRLGSVVLSDPVGEDCLNVGVEHDPSALTSLEHGLIDPSILQTVHDQRQVGADQAGEIEVVLLLDLGNLLPVCTDTFGPLGTVLLDGTLQSLVASVD